MMMSRRNRRAGVEDRWRRADGKPSAADGQGKRWRARWVDDAGQEHARGFRLKVEAQQFLDAVTADQMAGTYVDPQRGKITFDSFYREWSSRQVWVHNTVQAMDLTAASTTFRTVAMNDLRASHIEQWVKAMQDRGLAPGTIRMRFHNVRTILNAAVRDRVLGHDPTVKVALPRQRKSAAAMSVPSPAIVGQLLEKSDEDFVAFVAVAAFAGLRLGEAAALQVGDIDFLGRVIHVRRQVQRAEAGKVEIRLPKYGSERDVPAPDGLVKILAEHVRLWIGSEPTAWLFPGEKGNPMHQNSVGYRFRKTRVAVGADDVRLHDLRHFYASGLIAAGCDVVTVQRALGHGSPSVTLNTYAHLWPQADDRTRAAAAGLLDASIGTAADGLRTGDAK